MLPRLSMSQKSKDDLAMRLGDAEKRLKNARQVTLDSSQAYNSITEALEIIDEVKGEMRDEL